MASYLCLLWNFNCFDTLIFFRFRELFLSSFYISCEKYLLGFLENIQEYEYSRILSINIVNINYFLNCTTFDTNHNNTQYCRQIESESDWVKVKVRDGVWHKEIFEKITGWLPRKKKSTNNCWAALMNADIRDMRFSGSFSDKYISNMWLILNVSDRCCQLQYGG